MKSKLLMRKLKMSVIMVMHLEISVMKMKMSMMKTKMSMMKTKMLMMKTKISVMKMKMSMMKTKMSMMKTKISVMKLITMIHIKLKSMQSVMHLTVMTLMKNVMTFKMNYSILK